MTSWLVLLANWSNPHIFRCDEALTCSQTDRKLRRFRTLTVHSHRHVLHVSSSHVIDKQNNGPSAHRQDPTLRLSNNTFQTSASCSSIRSRTCHTLFIVPSFPQAHLRALSEHGSSNSLNPTPTFFGVASALIMRARKYCSQWAPLDISSRSQRLTKTQIDNTDKKHCVLIVGCNTVIVVLSLFIITFLLK